MNHILCKLVPELILYLNKLLVSFILFITKISKISHKEASYFILYPTYIFNFLVWEF